MSVSDRLKAIEQNVTALQQRLGALEQATAEQGAAVSTLVDALEAEAEQEDPPAITLDGDDAGAERDQSQTL